MHEYYQNPLITRYASREMKENFSDRKKFITWRKLWVALAEGEKELGLHITQEQIDELKAHVEDINYDVAIAREKEVRHDVMAHVYAYGLQCPKAKPIIHLGATSAYVGDNADIIIYRDGLNIIKKKLINAMNVLTQFALKYKNLPTLGFTHFQPAQLVTVGKRASLWLQDLLLDYQDLEYRIANMKLLGVKGTTGTQASFMELFNNDHEKVKKLEAIVAEKMGFKEVFPVSGQTYTRKLDSQILWVLNGIAQSAHKFSNDIRLLQHLREVEEPFEEKQIGSSAMAYKRNPMRSERMASLSRYVITLSLNPDLTAAEQWFERTLDDSANRRISIPEAFLAVDAILTLYINIASGLVVNEKVIAKHIEEELPFMATEAILMESVKNGGDRQELHEKIRQYSMEAAKRIKNGLNNNLLENIKSDPEFRIHDFDSLISPEKFIGRAPEQVEEFIENMIKPVLDKNKDLLGIEATVEV
ncbi:adenylosuccinate lyase [Caldanaerobius fijiensis DSM 17918]|uniref:Adenylosuccinate lyase n=1 Tax=Caldanaerobius fijiensis DSM 17918 TaxID=1121256 RepID=A0A1M4YCR7_9THEO|nr:adenylosuccinate lyase [Caldanaerobius fijiensis]SHF03489.1 adenylosuccinate lyase [Caldanaerobius fijiensis DSM 17918]